MFSLYSPIKYGMKPSDRSLKLYEKAHEAFKKNNFDYAINLLLKAVEVTPSYLQARHLLRLIEKKKLERSKAILLTRAIGNILSLHHYVIGYYHFTKQNHHKAIISFENILLKDPVNTVVLSSLGQSALDLDMIDTAVETFEFIRTLVPSKVKNLMKLGSIYKEKTRELEKAKDCFSSVLQYNKENYDARKEISDIAALQTIKDGSYDDMSSSFLNKVKDLDYTDIQEKKMRSIKSTEDLRTLIADTKQAHQAEPSNVKIIIELASYYQQAQEYDTAITYYNKARDITPEDYTLLRLIMNAEITKIDEQLTQVAQSDLDASQKQHYADQLYTQRIETAESFLRQLVEQRPTDRELRYELGRTFYEQNKINEAIKEFQYAVNEPRYRLRTLNYLGLCFMAAQMFDLAEVQFTSALQDSGSGGMDAFTKEIMYNLATVYEQTGQIDKAVDKYKEIYKVDIGFKDVADKIRQTYHR